MNSNSGKTMLSQKEMNAKASNALKRLDIPKMESRVLVCLFKKEGITAREIERIADLRQPEVSICANALKKKGWIKVSLTPKEGKGRPYDRFYLAKPMDKIRADIHEMGQKKLETEKQDMNALYDMLGIET